MCGINSGISHLCQIPLTMIVAWVKGVNVGLDFSLLETGSLAMTIFVTAFTLQVPFMRNRLAGCVSIYYLVVYQFDKQVNFVGPKMALHEGIRSDPFLYCHRGMLFHE